MGQSVTCCQWPAAPASRDKDTSSSTHCRVRQDGSFCAAAFAPSERPWVRVPGRPQRATANPEAHSNRSSLPAGPSQDRPCRPSGAPRLVAAASASSSRALPVCPCRAQGLASAREGLLVSRSLTSPPRRPFVRADAADHKRRHLCARGGSIPEAPTARQRKDRSGQAGFPQGSAPDPALSQRRRPRRGTQTGRRANLLLTALEAGSLRSGCQRAWGLVTAPFCFMHCWLLTWRERTRLSRLSLSGHESIREGPSCGPATSRRLLTASHREPGVSRSGGRDTNIQPTAIGASGTRAELRNAASPSPVSEAAWRKKSLPSEARALGLSFLDNDTSRD